jgi:hypothetical protein
MVSKTRVTKSSPERTDDLVSSLVVDSDHDIGAAGLLIEVSFDMACFLSGRGLTVQINAACHNGGVHT